MKDRKQLIQGLALALLIILCGFMLFVRPNLGDAAGGGVEADAETLLATLDAPMPLGTTPQQLEDKLREAGPNIEVVKADAVVVREVGAAYRVTLDAQGKTPDVLAYLATLSRGVYREGAQVRSSGGPLYVIEAMTLTPGAAGSSRLQATLLVPGQES